MGASRQVRCIPLTTNEIRKLILCFFLQDLSEFYGVYKPSWLKIEQIEGKLTLPFSKGDFPFFLFHEHGASLLAFMNSPKSC